MRSGSEHWNKDRERQFDHTIMKLTNEEIALAMLALDTRQEKLTAWLEISRTNLREYQGSKSVSAERYARWVHNAADWHSERVSVELLKAKLAAAWTTGVEV